MFGRLAGSSGSRQRGRAVLALVLSISCSTCGGESRTPREPARTSLLGSEPNLAVPSSRPGWRYHPGDAGALSARAVLPSGDIVYSGQKGERWLVHASGGAEVSAALAPEELVAIVPPRGGRAATGSGAHWLFVGRSGTTYESLEPLGTFVRSSAPLDPLVRVRESAGVLLGLRRDGALARSDTAGATWTKVGPDGVRFEDVALRSDGRGLALAIPEALFETRDFGASWKRGALPTMGTTALVQDETAGVVAQTILGVERWDPDGPTAFSPLGRAVAARTYSLGVPPPLGPSADALSAGRAVVIGSTWVEARPVGGLGWILVTGSFGERLLAAPLPTARGCEAVFVGGYGGELYLACARQKGEDRSQPIEFQRSTNGGRSWAPEPYYVVGRTGEFSMAVGAGGALVVSGVCPASARDAGCMPIGVHRRVRAKRDSGNEVELTQAATPSLVRTAFDLAFSLDGRTLFAVGRRFKSDALAVFVSHDGGETFEARDVEPLRLPQDEDDVHARQRADNPVKSSAAGADGTASFVVAAFGQQYWLVVDDDGRPVSLVKPPVPDARIGAAGASALAFDPVSRDAFESLDAGANFAPIGKLPIDPCSGLPRCEAKIVCTALGCVLGNVSSRIGWHVSERAVLPPPEPQEHAAAPHDPRAAGSGSGADSRPSPMSCALSPGEWQRVPLVSTLPSVQDAAIGKVAWFAVSADPKTASGSVFTMKAGPSARFEEAPLLGASRTAAKEAFAVSHKAGGAVAIRYAVPTGASGPNLKHIELAWNDVLASRAGHAVLEDGGVARPSDYGDGKGAASPANVALYELTNGGVYLRIHSSLGDDQPTLFLNGHSVESLPPVVWPEDARQRGRSFVAHVGSAHTPVRTDDARAPAPSVARARRGERDSWAFDAMTLGWNRPPEFGLFQRMDGVRFGERFGVHVTTYDAGAAWANGFVYPLRADGPVFDEPIAVPTQLDLPAVPRGCNAADRSMSPRVVVPYQPGTRHAVLVTDPVEPMRVLLTSDAVLHGTPEAPCVAAYEASVVSEPPSAQSERAILFLDALDRSWLFRAAEGSRDRPRALEYRAMTCRFDPTIPRDVLDQNGSSAPSR